MARRKSHAEHENHERWLISYADFITLLFAFFVVMYSLSAINEGKFRVLAQSLAASFRGPPRSITPIQVGHPVRPDLVENQDRAAPRSPAFPLADPVAVPENPMPLALFNRMKPPKSTLSSAGQRVEESPRSATPGGGGADAAQAVADGPGDGQPVSAGSASHGGADPIGAIAAAVREAMRDLIDRKLVTVRRFQFRLEVEINTAILYPSGSARFEPEAIPILRELSRILEAYDNPILVEGFTDDVPISTPLFPSNWELSTARATSVVHLLQGEGIRPERLAAVGHGEYKPTALNDTPAGRRENRKVVLVVLAGSSVLPGGDGLSDEVAMPGSAAEAQSESVP
jgi:chemotaxis protein MotB